MGQAIVENCAYRLCGGGEMKLGLQASRKVFKEGERKKESVIVCLVVWGRNLDK